MFNILRKSYIIKEGFWYSFVFMFSQFISLIGAFLVARYLGPHDLGFYTLTQVFMSILSIFLSSFDFYGHWHIVQQFSTESNNCRVCDLYMVYCHLFPSSNKNISSYSTFISAFYRINSFPFSFHTSIQQGKNSYRRSNDYFHHIAFRLKTLGNYT